MWSMGEHVPFDLILVDERPGLERVEILGQKRRGQQTRRVAAGATVAAVAVVFAAVAVVIVASVLTFLIVRWPFL